MFEKVGSKDGLLYVGDEENPRKRASQSEVESDGALAVGVDGGASVRRSRV